MSECDRGDMLFSYRMSSPPSGNAAPGASGLVVVAMGFNPVNSGFAGCWPNVPWSQVSFSEVKRAGLVVVRLGPPLHWNLFY